jgi:hypothetical protein
MSDVGYAFTCKSMSALPTERSPRVFAVFGRRNLKMNQGGGFLLGGFLRSSFDSPIPHQRL